MTGPQLMMLWETSDPAEALAHRFHFATSERAVDWFADTLSTTWAIQLEECVRLVISAQNLMAWITTSDAQVVAKCSASPALFARLADTTQLTAWLSDRGVPVAAPIRARDGRLRAELQKVSMEVLPVVDGQLLDVGIVEQVTEAGRMLARLHEELRSYPHPFRGGPRAEGQLVHNDFRSANVLHDGSRITAVLDFEEVAYRSRVADLAKATVMLATRYHDWAPTTSAVREAFIGAYEELAPLSRSEHEALRHGIAVTLDHFGWV